MMDSASGTENTRSKRVRHVSTVDFLHINAWLFAVRTSVAQNSATIDADIAAPFLSLNPCILYTIWRAVCSVRSRCATKSWRHEFASAYCWSAVSHRLKMAGQESITRSHGLSSSSVLPEAISLPTRKTRACTSSSGDSRTKAPRGNWAPSENPALSTMGDLTTFGVIFSANAETSSMFSGTHGMAESKMFCQKMLMPHWYSIVDGPAAQ